VSDRDFAVRLAAWLLFGLVVFLLIYFGDFLFDLPNASAWQ